jgi:hypothetical protein
MNESLVGDVQTVNDGKLNLQLMLLAIAMIGAGLGLMLLG